MAEVEFKLEDRIQLAVVSHKRFVDALWSRFGFDIHPGYCSIQIIPLLSLGGFSREPTATIFLNEMLTDSELKYEAYHETAHFLDPFTKTLYDGKIEPLFEDMLLHETLANLATMVYLDLFEGSVLARNYPFYNGKPTYSSLLALDLFEANKHILSRLLHLDMEEARNIILPYLRRPLDLKKSAYDQTGAE